ncbi:MAG: hypothetical protein JXB29_07310 [Sedimentisphaerales bacterium]|nr:hypothetical protein [Sedimentisphaerales bacterium]
MKKTMVSVIVLGLFAVSVLSYAGDADKPAIPQREPGKAGGWPELKAAAEAEKQQVKEKLMLVSWGDLIYFYGPETDPGLYTRRQIRNMMKYWKDQGFTQAYWRSEMQNPDFVWNRSTIGATHSFIQSEIVNIEQKLDTTRAAREIAKEMGLEFYYWHSIYDDGTPPDVKTRIWSSGFPWRNSFFDKHPELDILDRNGNKQWGVRELAYPLARQQKIDEYIDFVQKYRPDGILLYLHSHSAAGEHGDQYGFNPVIVDEYKKRYGIDILTDQRFDYKDPNFNQKAEALEKWRALRGEYLTQFLREMKAALNEIQPGIKIAINTQGGDYFGPPFGNMKIDWRTWIKEDLINVLIVRAWMAGSMGAYDFSKEGYLTWGDGELGVTPYEEIRKVISQSSHNVKLITRARTYIEAADGYYDAVNRDSTYPKNQRIKQLKENLAKYGSTGYIEQDFDTCKPLEKTGYVDFRGVGKRYFIGDPRYYASKNSSPGWAGPLTEDTATSPALVDLAKIAGKGMGVYLDNTGGALTIIRRTGRDWPDELVSNGKLIITFDCYRKASAAINVSTMAGRGVRDSSIQISVDENGKLLAGKTGKMVATNHNIPENTWTTLGIDIDFDKASYSVTANGQNIADAAGSLNAKRTAFDGLMFNCREGAVYIDNIKAKWSW